MATEPEVKTDGKDVTVQDLSPEDLINRQASLLGIRQYWDTHWHDVAVYILPGRQDVSSSLSPGQRLLQNIFNNTGITSNESLAAFLHSLLTNPQTRWFELTTGNDLLDKQDDVRQWLQDVAKIIFQALNNSNFQTEVHELYLDLGGIGTGSMSALEDDEFDIRFKTNHIKEICIAEDAFGRVREVYRQFDWTVRQIMDVWGAAAIEKSQSLKSEVDKPMDTTFSILHAVYPSKRGATGSRAAHCRRSAKRRRRDWL